MHWSSLPRFGEEKLESSKQSTKLTGWIRHDDYRGQRLDGLDPYARDIRYPPREVGEPFVSLLSLTTDSERREWRLPDALNPSLICEVWSDKRIVKRDEAHRFGERIQASADLLKMLCKRTQKDLVLEVSIKRRLNRTYSSGIKDDMGPVPPSRKIFVLSSNGVLRDKDKKYQVW
jgi:hypothetical protein